MKGSHVKKTLRETGFSLTKIAEKMDVSPQTLNKMLNVNDIKVGVLQRIAKAAGKDIFFFLGDPDTIYFSIPKVDSMKNDKRFLSFLEMAESMKNYLLIFK